MKNKNFNLEIVLTKSIFIEIYRDVPIFLISNICLRHLNVQFSQKVELNVRF